MLEARVGHVDAARFHSQQSMSVFLEVFVAVLDEDVQLVLLRNVLIHDINFRVGGKDLMGKMFGSMLPKGTDAVKLSKMNMGGMGTFMMKSLMKKKNVASLEQMLEMAGELGVQIYVCEMSMDLMGFKREEMIEYPHMDFCGVAKYLEEAKNSKVQLFI